MIRYPGSKAKLVSQIEALAFPDSLTMDLWHSKDMVYCEPFFGSGAMANVILNGLPRSTRLVFSDLDLWLVCLWNAVYKCPSELCDRIDAFTPTADRFFQYKEEDGSVIDPVEAGFRKLVLHQISFSGLGCMAGGPLGGKASNNSEYSPSCRWHPTRLKKQIAYWHKTLQRFRRVDIRRKDFGPILEELPSNAFVYLDPPYYEKGAQLYKHNMTDEDHMRLASCLHKARFRWALSYDDHPRIRALYQWAKVSEVPVTYTVATAKCPARRKNHEIVITQA